MVGSSEGGKEMPKRKVRGVQVQLVCGVATVHPDKADEVRAAEALRRKESRDRRLKSEMARGGNLASRR